MSTTMQTTDFLTTARQAAVWDEARFAEAVPDEARLPVEPTVCAEVLVKKGLLTKFQAKLLLAGKAKQLLLGAYRILEPLGTQGGNTLFLGEHTGLKRRVVLKILDDKAEDRTVRERFFREARSAAALDHPNIARLFDICRHNGTPFLVLEHLDGYDLQALLTKAKKLSIDDALSAVLQAARGLAHAHERGIVHRDIRPANLFLTRNGVVKIKNLGLARSLTSESDNVTSVMGGGVVVEAAEYQSLEQILNEPLDQRSDVYSLGATLFALIAGRPPFSGSLMEVMVAHQSGTMPRLSDFATDVPKELEEVVSVMMARKRSERYENAAEAMKALGERNAGAPKSVGRSLAALAARTPGKISAASRIKVVKRLAAVQLPAPRLRRSLGIVLGALCGAMLVAASAFMLVKMVMGK